MIIVIQNQKTLETRILLDISMHDEIELEDHEVIIASKFECTHSLYNDDLYGSRPGEHGICDYELSTSEAETQSDFLENFYNQY